MIWKEKTKSLSWRKSFEERKWWVTKSQLTKVVSSTTIISTPAIMPFSVTVETFRSLNDIVTVGSSKDNCEVWNFRNLVRYVQRDSSRCWADTEAVWHSPDEDLEFTFCSALDGLLYILSSSSTKLIFILSIIYYPNMAVCLSFSSKKIEFCAFWKQSILWPSPHEPPPLPLLVGVFHILMSHINHQYINSFW